MQLLQFKCVDDIEMWYIRGCCTSVVLLERLECLRHRFLRELRIWFGRIDELKHNGVN